MMTSTISNANSMKEPAAPNFVLTLLAACSSAVPAVGQEGEAKISEQLTGLLRAKAVTLEELHLLYSYKFGFSIDNALKLAGFNGKVEEFLAEQKCFSIQEGFISMKPVDIVVNIDETSTFHEPAKMKEPLATCTTVDAGVASVQRALPTAKDFGFEPAVDGGAASAQHDLPNVKDFGFEPAKDERALPTILDFGFKSVDDDASVTSITDTDSTTDSESSQADIDFDDIDISGWHSIGNRLVAVLGKDSDDVDTDGVRWKVLGGRIATAFSSDGIDTEAEDIEDKGANIVAWHDIGNRVMTACERSNGVD